jgi:dCMP deaminase
MTEMKRSQRWWDLYHLHVAREIASGSKDPSTQVGAVIVRPDRTVAATGYNGFPRGIADTPDRLNNREVKYGLVVHGEINAILTAREPLHGYTLYTWPFLTCARCGLHVIQSGIKRVVAPMLPDELKERWSGSLREAQELYEEAGVFCELVDMTPVKDIG